MHLNIFFPVFFFVSPGERTNKRTSDLVIVTRMSPRKDYEGRIVLMIIILSLWESNDDDDGDNDVIFTVPVDSSRY